MAFHGGLQGKARRVHQMRRAARLQAREMIEEYFEPGDRRVKPHRFIPVRSRVDVLSSVSAVDVEPRSIAIGKQMELPLVARVEMEPVKTVTKANPNNRPVDDEPRILRFPTLTDAKSESPESQPTTSIQPVQAVPAKSSNPVPTLKPWHTRPKKPFSIRGFLSGCAMGGVAAALVLTTLWVIVR